MNGDDSLSFDEEFAHKLDCQNDENDSNEDLRYPDPFVLKQINQSDHQAH